VVNPRPTDMKKSGDLGRVPETSLISGEGKIFTRPSSSKEDVKLPDRRVEPVKNFGQGKEGGERRREALSLRGMMDAIGGRVHSRTIARVFQPKTGLTHGQPTVMGTAPDHSSREISSTCAPSDARSANLCSRLLTPGGGVP
jgi:hypothetical protein